MSNYIAIDVGGTMLKGAITNSNGEFISETIRLPSDSKANADRIFMQLTKLINALYNTTLFQKGIDICGIGLGFPGPFDYKNGISLMEGIGKFDSIYGISIKDKLRELLNFNGKICFANDADLYALGEANFGVAASYSRVFAVCIGTGLGSGFCVDGKLIKNGTLVPENGWIYNTAYRDSIADFYGSATGIFHMMRQNPDLAGFSDVKQLADAAKSGNTEALALFSQFGNVLCDIILPHALKFNAECVVIGGDVAKSGKLFLSALNNNLQKHKITLLTSQNFSDITLKAVSLLFRKDE